MAALPCALVNVVEKSPLGAALLEPTVYLDERGSFHESFNKSEFADLTGFEGEFVQDNHSTSARGVLRGLHYQAEPQAQGKLVRVARGSVFDVAVDVRKSSPTFGQWFGAELSGDNRRQLWIPIGLAHGFLVLAGPADLLYKVTDYYSSEHDRSIRWNDPEIGIEWPVDGEPILSDRDATAPYLAEAEVFA